MAFSARIFVDFWNFQLHWNQRVTDAQCDWKKLPREALHESQRLLNEAGVSEDCQLDETLVCASVLERSIAGPARTPQRKGPRPALNDESVKKTLAWWGVP